MARTTTFKRGSLYRAYANNTLKYDRLCRYRLVQDIIEITGQVPPVRGNKNNLYVLEGIMDHMHAKAVLENWDINNTVFRMLIVAFNFGFMQGGRAVREKRKRGDIDG